MAVSNVSGKIALITGAASGIGLKCAYEFLRHGLKAVTIVDLNVESGEETAKKLNNQYGEKVATFVRADLTNSNEIENAFATAIDEWKSLDIVINNAGIMRDSQWKKEIELNCNAVVSSSLLAMKYMGKNNGAKGGIVVNIASILGLQEFVGCPIYVGTKHFVLGFTRSIGQPFFYHTTGVKFLTMCPGATLTPLVSEAKDYALDGLGTLITEQISALPSQSAEHVAKNMMMLFTQGENGSVWVCEGGESVYEVRLPDRKTLRIN